MKKSYVTMAMLVLSVIMVVTGILNQQNQMVLAKAIKICLECIGIG